MDNSHQTALWRRQNVTAAGIRPHFRRGMGIGVILAATVLIAACSSPSGSHVSATASATSTAAPTATVTSAPATPTSTASSYPVKVYFSRHPDSDNNPALVFPVNRMAPSLAVATYAITQLIAGPTSSEQSAGYYTPLSGAINGPSNCGGADFQITLNMKGTTPEAGTATLKFCRTVSLAGDLTGGYIRSEINSTLLQFPTIKKVVILTASGSCFDDLSGQNLCLH